MTLRNITCAVTLCLLTLSGQAVGKTEVPPYKNKSLSIEKRVDDLMGRMTLREKVLQLQNRGAGRLDEIDRIFNGESYGCTHEMGTTAAECAAMYKELQGSESPLLLLPKAFRESCKIIVRCFRTLWRRGVPSILL